MVLSEIKKVIIIKRKKIPRLIILVTLLSLAILTIVDTSTYRRWYKGK